MKANYTYKILRLADVYGRYRNHSRKTVSLRAAKRGGFFDELENGGNITVNRAEAIISWFSCEWPSDLQWPGDVDRPAPERKDVA